MNFSYKTLLVIVGQLKIRFDFGTTVNLRPVTDNVKEFEVVATVTRQSTAFNKIDST